MRQHGQGKSRTRIQRQKTAQIHAAALSVFAAEGYRGATLDQIALAADMSKPNLLYYFPSKAAVYTALLENLIETWLDPLRALNNDREPLDAILDYVCRKLAMSRDYPRESRLFANEILQGAPHIGEVLSGELKDLVDEKAALIRRWVAAGKIRDVDPVHLIFSIWSLTQHYADFDVQVHAVLGESTDPYPDAEAYLTTLFTRMLHV
ncbi:MAG: TetR family transcriptional regulator C-terminal domain-containing protein [Pseudomonadota bacterium]